MCIENEKSEQVIAIYKPPESAAIAIAFYNAARSEIVQRLSMRDTTVLAWITTVGVLLGWAIKDASGNDMKDWLMVLIPVMSLAFTFSIYRHTMIIDSLGRYIGRELHRFLGQEVAPSLVPYHWDNSNILNRRGKTYLLIERNTYLVLMAGPPLGCVLYLWSQEVRFHDLRFWIASASTLVVAVAFVVEIGRAMLYGATNISQSS
jgi:hypothetical protein